MYIRVRLDVGVGILKHGKASSKLYQTTKPPLYTCTYPLYHTVQFPQRITSLSMYVATLVSGKLTFSSQDTRLLDNARVFISHMYSIIKESPLQHQTLFHCRTAVSSLATYQEPCKTDCKMLRTIYLVFTGYVFLGFLDSLPQMLLVFLPLHTLTPLSSVI